MQLWFDLNSPKDKWGPALDENRIGERYATGFEPKMHYTPSKVYDVELEFQPDNDLGTKVSEKNGILPTEEKKNLGFENGRFGQTNQGYEDHHM